MDTKKVYETPKLIVHGDITKITQGSGLGIKDFFVFGAADPIGGCSHEPWSTIRIHCS